MRDEHTVTQKSKRRETRTAFTLVELMVVVATLILLLSILAPAAFRAVLMAEKTKIKTFITTAADAITMFKGDHSLYPGQQWGNTVNALGVTGSEVLAEAFWEPPQVNKQLGGKEGSFDLNILRDNNILPNETYMPFKKEYCLIAGNRAFIADPSSIRKGSGSQPPSTMRAMLYYPAIVGNRGIVGDENNRLNGTFYVDQNTQAGVNYLPDTTLNTNVNNGDPLNLINTKFDPSRINNYDAFLLILPFRNTTGNREYFQDYNLTNILKEKQK